MPSRVSVIMFYLIYLYGVLVCKRVGARVGGRASGRTGGQVGGWVWLKLIL